jgi:hypothetical protein
MAIGSYPRVTVQGTGAANNIQNGLGLMVLNPSTGKYEAATASTFGGGGGGGGDATAANQTTQIGEATTTNSKLGAIETEILTLNSTTATSANQTAQISEATTTNTNLTNIKTDIESTNTELATQTLQLTDIVTNTSLTQNFLIDSVSEIPAANLLGLINTNTATSANQTTEIAFLTDIKNLLTTIDTTLTDIKNNATNGSQKVIITDVSGTNVDVDSGTKRLLVDTGA